MDPSVRVSCVQVIDFEKSHPLPSAQLKSCAKAVDLDDESMTRTNWFASISAHHTHNVFQSAGELGMVRACLFSPPSLYFPDNAVRANSPLTRGESGQPDQLNTFAHQVPPADPLHRVSFLCIAAGQSVSAHRSPLTWDPCRQTANHSGPVLFSLPGQRAPWQTLRSTTYHPLNAKRYIYIWSG